MHGNIEGLVARSGDTAVTDWLFEYKHSLPFLAQQLRGWSPQGRLSAFRSGCSGSVRWSKAIMPSDHEADGSGLDLRLESSVQAPWEHSAENLRFQQRAEVVFGPRAQAKYLNVSLPFGVLLGAVAGNSVNEDDSSGNSIGPVRLYGKFSTPGISRLNGWTADGQVQDAQVGHVSGEVYGPWHSSREQVQWFLKHVRSHGPIRLPRFVGNSLAAVSSLFPGEEKTGQLTPRPVVIPSTKIRLSSEGTGAALGLESSPNLGGSGWNGIVEVGPLGWGTRLSVAAGNADSELGQPRYSVSAHAPWKGNASLTHELKWMFTDGQWAGVTIRDGGPNGGKRVNFGVEIR